MKKNKLREILKEGKPSIDTQISPPYPKSWPTRVLKKTFS